MFSRCTILLKQWFNKYLLCVIINIVPLWALINFSRELRFSKSKNASGSSIIIKSGLVSISLITWISLNSPPLSSDTFKSLCLISVARFSLLLILISKSFPPIASNASKACWYFSSKTSVSEEVSISVQIYAISFCNVIYCSPIYSKTVVSFVLSSFKNWLTYPILQFGSISNFPSNIYSSGSIIISISVLFPLPLLPINAQCWPSSSSNEILLYNSFWGYE